MFCICCVYYMLIFFYRWFEFSMGDSIPRVKILRGFLFPSFQFSRFFHNRKNTTLKTHKISVLIRYVIYFCLVSKSGHFLWQSEEYSLKPLKLLLSVLVGSIDEDATLSIFDPHPSRSVTGLCATIGIDRLYCPVRVFSFLHKNGRKR